MSNFQWFGVVVIGLFFAGGLITAAVVALGFALGWFRIGAGRKDGKSQVTFTLEEDKIREDEDTIRERARDLGHREKDQSPTPVATKKDVVAPAA